MADDQSTPERLRAHPRERFAGAQHLFDFKHELEELRAEAHAARDGHRQKSLLHRGAVTQVLFAFAEGGAMREHKARGLVTILCLEGSLEIEAAGEKHALEALDQIVLDVEVPHSVRATQESAMLLTVFLQS